MASCIFALFPPVQNIVFLGWDSQYGFLYLCPVSTYPGHCIFRMGFPKWLHVSLHCFHLFGTLCFRDGIPKMASCIFALFPPVRDIVFPGWDSQNGFLYLCTVSTCSGHCISGMGFQKWLLVSLHCFHLFGTLCFWDGIPEMASCIFALFPPIRDIVFLGWDSRNGFLYLCTVSTCSGHCVSGMGLKKWPPLSLHCFHLFGTLCFWDGIPKMAFCIFALFPPVWDIVLFSFIHFI